MLFWCPRNLEPLYKSEVATPGCCVLIGGGGISEAEDIKAIEALLQHSVRTGMFIASRGKPGPRLICAREGPKVGKEMGSTGEAAHLLASLPGPPVKALLGSLKIGGPQHIARGQHHHV